MKIAEEYKKYAEHNLGRGDTFGEGIKEVKNQLYGKVKIR